MFDNLRYTTSELEKYIKSVYSKIEPLAFKDGVFKPLDDHFGEGIPNNADGSFCFSDKDGYHYCVIERGQLITDETTESLFEITFTVISNDIFWMAVDFERKHRINGQDFRRLLFRKELQYWSVLGEDFKQKAEQRIGESLVKSPFTD